jgi:helix-turn-helix protein
MSGSVVADFVAEALHAGVDGDEPRKVRVLLSEDRLVIASDGGRTVIDLDDVFDVVVSKIPEDLGRFLDQSVLVAYADGETRRTALIRGEHDRIDRFALFLHRAILGGTTATVRHPTSEGGRVRDPPVRQVAVVPTRDEVHFRSDDGDVTIALEDVLGVTYDRRSIDGRERPVLSIQYDADGTTTTTDVAHDDANRLNVLARHLRSEYYRAGEILSDIEIDETEKRALVALYAGVPPTNLERVLAVPGDDAGSGPGSGTGQLGQAGNAEGQPVDAEALLTRLVEKELVADPESGALTHDGALVAIHRIEDVAE